MGKVTKDVGQGGHQTRNGIIVLILLMIFIVCTLAGTYTLPELDMQIPPGETRLQLIERIEADIQGMRADFAAHGESAAAMDADYHWPLETSLVSLAIHRHILETGTIPKKLSEVWMDEETGFIAQNYSYRADGNQWTLYRPKTPVARGN